MNGLTIYEVIECTKITLCYAAFGVGVFLIANIINNIIFKKNI